MQVPFDYHVTLSQWEMEAIIRALRATRRDREQSLVLAQLSSTTYVQKARRGLV